jgi:hypothetical protein
LDQQPLGGALPGAVAIKGDEQLLGAMALQQLELQRRKDRSQARNGIGKTSLVELDHIQQPFHQQGATALADRLFGLIQAKDQHVALEEQIAAAVAVLGLWLTGGPAAKSHGQA